MQIVRLKSQHSVSPYAPTWDIPMGLCQWMKWHKIDEIKEFLLSKEDYILSLPYNTDANTRLKEDSITTRFGKYHLFDFVDECPALEELLEWIKEQYREFVLLDQTQLFELDFSCWYNIIRTGDEIKSHRHASDPLAYLSGNMHLDNYDSFTCYNHMGMINNIPNIKGGLTFFPSYLKHGVDKYMGKEPRVSLAFDTYIKFDLVNVFQIDTELHALPKEVNLKTFI